MLCWYHGYSIVGVELCRCHDSELLVSCYRFLLCYQPPVTGCYILSETKAVIRQPITDRKVNEKDWFCHSPAPLYLGLFIVTFHVWWGKSLHHWQPSERRSSRSRHIATPRFCSSYPCRRATCTVWKMSQSIAVNQHLRREPRTWSQHLRTWR